MRRLLTFILVGIAVGLYAQSTITGKVVDATTGDPLPYVTLSFVGVKGGAVTNFDGYYTIIVTTGADSIKASYMGYESVVQAIDGQNEINFTLTESAAALQEFVVKPGGINPAEVIMKRVQKNKKKYNPERIEFYEYEGYNKIQLAVDNVTDKFKKRKVFEAMSPLFDTVSSFSDSSAQKVLPVFVSETISDYYYRKFPRRTKEVIKATKVVGVGVGDESYVSQILGSTFQQYNFYENNLYIMDKDFISPLSFQANSYYFFTLLDSTEIAGESCYKIKVDPKNPKDLVFSGILWVSATSYAVKQLSLEITKEANLNFVEKLKIQQEYTEVEPTYWLPSKTRIVLDIAEITGNTVGLIGLYYNSAKNLRVNKVRELPFFEDKLTVEENAYSFGESYWDTTRHESISAEDKRIYEMVDSLKNQPLIKTYVDVVEVLVEGHLPMGKLELGPYQYLIGFNNLEGFKTRIGLRTSPTFHPNWNLSAYGAYGFRDKQFKYGATARYVFDRNKWGRAGAMIKRDVELIGLTDEDIGTSALFDAFAALGVDNLNRSFIKRVWLEKELIKGYTQKVIFTHKNFEFEPIGNFNFGFHVNADTNVIASNYDISTVKLRGRLSHKEQFIIRRNQRLSLGNLKAPVLTLDYTQAFNNLLGGDFGFQQVGFELWQFNSAGNWGTFEYNIKAYKTFGTAPYPSLFIMRGNQSWFSNKQTYNLMNFFEFVADQYIAADYEHQFNGLIMNRVPLVRHLKWRSFVYSKAVYGTLSEANRALMPERIGFTNPNTFSNGIPYVELGYGIENIFRFIRIDFIHRLTYIDPEYLQARSFGVKANAVFRF
jgi:hypothetical protein